MNDLLYSLYNSHNTSITIGGYLIELFKTLLGLLKEELTQSAFVIFQKSVYWGFSIQISNRSSG